MSAGSALPGLAFLAPPQRGHSGMLERPAASTQVPGGSPWSHRHLCWSLHWQWGNLFPPGHLQTLEASQHLSSCPPLPPAGALGATTAVGRDRCWWARARCHGRVARSGFYTAQTPGRRRRWHFGSSFFFFFSLESFKLHCHDCFYLKKKKKRKQRKTKRKRKTFVTWICFPSSVFQSAGVFP